MALVHRWARIVTLLLLGLLIVGGDRVQAESPWQMDGDWASITSGSAPSSALFAVDSAAVGTGDLVNVTSIYAVNWAQAGTEAYLSVAGGEYLFYVGSSVADAGIVYSGSVWLAAGDKIRVEFAGATAGDVVYLYCNGVRYTQNADVSAGFAALSDLPDTLAVFDSGLQRSVEFQQQLFYVVCGCLAVMAILLALLVAG